MLIWFLAIDCDPPDKDALLKYVLRLIQKGPRIKLILYVSQARPYMLWCGQPNLNTLRALEAVLDRPNPLYELLTDRDMKMLKRWCLVLSRGKAYDMHLTTVSTEPIGDNFFGKIDHFDRRPGMMETLFVDRGCQSLFGAPKIFECPLTLNELVIQVEGFSTLREAPVPSPIVLVNGKAVRDRPRTAPKGPEPSQAFDYGATSVPFTPELANKLKTPVCTETKLEIRGFFERPLPSKRLPGATLVRPCDPKNVAFTAMVRALCSLQKSAFVLYSRGGSRPELCALSPIGDSGSTRLLMEQLPFSQDWPIIPLQFPPLSIQPRHKFFDSLIDDLPDLTDCFASGTPDPAIGTLLENNLGMANPLADRIYNEIMRAFHDSRPPIKQDAQVTEVRTILVVDSKELDQDKKRICNEICLRHLQSNPCQNVELLEFDPDLLSYHPMPRINQYHTLGDPLSTYFMYSGNLPHFPDLSSMIENRLRSYPDVNIEFRILTTMPAPIVALCKHIKQNCDKKVTFEVQDAAELSYSNLG